MIKLIKNKYSSFIVVFFSSIFLQSCWLKKCDDPDAEHRSWTMVPEGRTTDFIFKCVSGKSFSCRSKPPTYSRLGSSMEVCEGTTFSCEIDSPYTNEYLVWSTNKYSNGNEEIRVVGVQAETNSIVFVKDTMIAFYKNSPWSGSRQKVKYVKILRNAGIFQINMNDTIYDKIN